MESKEQKQFKHRFYGLAIVVVLVFVILVCNLWRLQISQGPYYSAMTEGNSTKIIPIPPVRGDIVDKNGKILATSTPEFNLMLDETSITNPNNVRDVVQRLAPYVKPFWPTAESQENIIMDILAMAQDQKVKSYQPVTIMKNIPSKLQAEIAEHQNELPGVSVEAGWIRSYPLKTLAGQDLGYVRQISQDEIDQYNQNQDAQKVGFVYSQGDDVGKTGVEKSYDFWLRGIEGSEYAVVNNNGRPIDKKIIKEPQPGKTVKLTLDADLQQVVETSLDTVIQSIQKEHPQSKAGSAVVIDVNTGKILAMASRPVMDPNDLIGPISQETAEQYFQNSDGATLNRALSGLYAPGSTFKMITAMAALQGKVTTPTESIPDVISSLGSKTNQSQGFIEWGGNNFGPVNLYRGIALSSDIYFEVMGQRIFDSSPELVKQIANEFGLGIYSGVDLPGESKGIAPSPSWKKEYFTSYFQKQYSTELKAIDTKYSKEIAQAQDAVAKQNLQKDEETNKKQAEAKFKSNVAQNINWQLYDSYNDAVGQGYNVYTPLQLANYVATIVNGGIHYQPYIVDKIYDQITGKLVLQKTPKVLNHVSVSPDILMTIKKAMSDTTNGEGTANFLFSNVSEFSGGAKTGTAQLGSQNTVGAELYNGVFVAFAPYDHPQIAFAGVVDYGGHGGDTAGLVAKAAFMKYFGWK